MASTPEPAIRLTAEQQAQMEDLRASADALIEKIDALGKAGEYGIAKGRIHEALSFVATGMTRPML